MDEARRTCWQAGGGGLPAGMSGTVRVVVPFFRHCCARLVKQYETATLPILLYSDKRLLRSLATGASCSAAGPRRHAGCSPSVLHAVTASFMAARSCAAWPSASSAREMTSCSSVIIS